MYGLFVCLFRSQAIHSCKHPQGSGFLRAQPFALPPQRCFTFCNRDRVQINAHASVADIRVWNIRDIDLNQGDVITALLLTSVWRIIFLALRSSFHIWWRIIRYFSSSSMRSPCFSLFVPYPYWEPHLLLFQVLLSNWARIELCLHLYQQSCSNAP